MSFLWKSMPKKTFYFKSDLIFQNNFRYVQDKENKKAHTLIIFNIFIFYGKIVMRLLTIKTTKRR